MPRRLDWSEQWIFLLTAGLMVGSIFLRTALIYQNSPAEIQVFSLLAAWVALFAIQPGITRRWPRVAPGYFILQSALVMVFFFTPIITEYDYFALLFSVLAMQAMQCYPDARGWGWVAVFSALTAGPILLFEGVREGLPTSILYISIMVFLGYYAYSSQRARLARLHNQELARELEAANLKLKAYATNLADLAAARERQRLARELHDAVTQTVFSMTLTTEAAVIMLERNPNHLPEQLEHLIALVQNALAEIQTLITGLRPSVPSAGSLETALRNHLTERDLPPGLSVDLTMTGAGALSPAEEQALFRIAQEAINNIVKHAQASHVWIRLNLDAPASLEIEDNGRGFVLATVQTADDERFDPAQAQAAAGLGLNNMTGRAAEVGWALQVISSPGKGALVQVTRPENLAR